MTRLKYWCHDSVGHMHPVQGSDSGLYHPHKRLSVGYVSMTSVLGKQRGEGSQDLLPDLAELVNSNFEGGGNLFK